MAPSCQGAKPRWACGRALKLNISFDNSYARELQGFYVPCQPVAAPKPELIYFNRDLADELDLALSGQPADALAEMLCGNKLPEGSQPIAQAYAGHQFGHFSPQLGDGRALLIGEVIDRCSLRRDIAFKGSGRTPFSRNGDGKAALGPMLREVLIGEAMHALGIPSTRALAVVSTGESVRRERLLPGAVLTRVAMSHLRVGTFQFFAAHGTPDMVRRLADYAIARHYPELAGVKDRYLAFLRSVADRQAALVSKWMHAGFIHGVMNTDNMSIAGESIDFGPCAFLESYDPRAVFSSIDETGRYAYGQQPRIAQWNIARLAETLLNLIDEHEGTAVSLATEVIESFTERYQHYWLCDLRARLGLQEQADQSDSVDRAIGENWLNLLQEQQVDFTLAWRRLANAVQGNEQALRSLFTDQTELDRWLLIWKQRCAPQDSQQAERMLLANPLLIPRNHLVEEALSAASEERDLKPFENLLDALKNPFDESLNSSRYAEPASKAFMASFQTFCGT